MSDRLESQSREKKSKYTQLVQLYKYTLRRVINSKDEITRGSRDYRSLIETIS